MWTGRTFHNHNNISAVTDPRIGFHDQQQLFNNNKTGVMGFDTTFINQVNFKLNLSNKCTSYVKIQS